MKKFTVLALVWAFVLSACQINLPIAATNPAPTQDLAATVISDGLTAAAQTQAAQPSPTTVPPSETPLPPSPVIETVAPITDTPAPDLTTTPATATSAPADLLAASTPTFTPTLVTGGSPTASPTLGILTYGTLPPQNNPYVGITIVNKSRAEAYISLQVVTDQGYTIIEYPVKRVVKILIPTGDYTYVVWVGGRQFVGYFHIGKDTDLTINIFKDKVEVKKGE